MAQPDFIIIGGTKCGTTSLTGYLDRHTDVYLAPKELRYFTKEHRWHLGEDWYRRQFAEAGPNQIVGEASNAYTRDPVYAGAARRVHEALPEAKLIYLIREPWARMASHYRHRMVTGREWRPANRALREEPSYLAVSQYGHQLSLYRKLFPKRQILVLSSEGLFREPKKELSRLCGFLGIPFKDLPLEKENASADRRAVSSLLRPLARFPFLQPLLHRSRNLLPGDLSSEIAFSVTGATKQLFNRKLNSDRRLLLSLIEEDAVCWPYYDEDLHSEPNPKLSPTLTQAV
ncbi:sulfotransferase family protein [Parvularcula maris]|uniref:Sulfotransferase domain-containing protein n=1 Tax=Parvularcula maris TaxID=2965077 RepID=A0A9X2LAY7_9PROT|nr:sulfotransferase [Parvularcula maris]MCQ8186319.1 sulfotransferase domain-containing protein [Parvularcula maris]